MSYDEHKLPIFGHNIFFFCLLTQIFFQVINERREYLRSLKQPQTANQEEGSKKKNLAFLDMLLKAEEDGEKFMSQKDIRDQVSTFMFEVCILLT